MHLFSLVTFPFKRVWFLSLFPQTWRINGTLWLTVWQCSSSSSWSISTNCSCSFGGYWRSISSRSFPASLSWLLSKRYESWRIDLLLYLLQDKLKPAWKSYFILFGQLSYQNTTRGNVFPFLLVLKLSTVYNCFYLGPIFSFLPLLALRSISWRGAAILVWLLLRYTNKADVVQH